MHFVASPPSASRFVRHCKERALTLVEAMVSLFILAIFLIGFLVTVIASRRVTETSVMHAAATSIVYGVLEQMKQLAYETSLPSTVADPGAPVGTTLPFVRVRLNQSEFKWLTVVYTEAPNTPLGPITTPAPNATAASVGGGAINNVLGAMPLSTTTGTRSQSINLNLWIWIDEIPDTTTDVSEVKRITIVYTYTFQDGASTRTIRNREVTIRTRYDQ
jgi:competence protein ComGC